RRNHPAIARADYFPRMKGEAGELGRRTDRTSLVARSQSASSVLEYANAAAASDLEKCIDITCRTDLMYEHDRSGARGKPPLDIVWIEVEGSWVDLREHGPCPDVADCVCGSDVAHRGNDHLVPGPDLQDDQREMQGRSAAAAGHGVAGTCVGRHSLFERLHTRALREPSAGNYLANSLHFLLSEDWLRNGNHREYSCHCWAAIARFRHSTSRRSPSSRPMRARNPSFSAAFETSASRRGTGFTARSGRNSGLTFKR